MKKYLAILLAASFLLALPAGCGEGEEAPLPEEETGTIKIGFSMATLMEDRWLRDRDIFLAKAQQKDMEVIIRNANTDSDVQYKQVRELLEQKVDVLVIAANDAQGEAGCVEAAKAQGVPVILYDRLIWDSGADVYISFDNVMVGRLMAEYLLEKAPEGGYLLVNGPQTDNNCLMIREGYMEVLQPGIDAGDIWILAETWCEGWVRENAYDFVIELFAESRVGGLSSGPDDTYEMPAADGVDYREELVAVICENDSLAWGVTDAFSEARVSKVPVVGMDADLSACQRIVAGKQDLTVYKPIQNLVAATLEACEALATGEPVDADRTIHDGKNDIPYIAIEVYPVTFDTLEETVIADRFHLPEEVYGH